MWLVRTVMVVYKRLWVPKILLWRIRNIRVALLKSKVGGQSHVGVRLLVSGVVVRVLPTWGRLRRGLSGMGVVRRRGMQMSSFRSYRRGRLIYHMGISYLNHMRVRVITILVVLLFRHLVW